LSGASIQVFKMRDSIVGCIQNRLITIFSIEVVSQPSPGPSWGRAIAKE
jgi:hypothetical protein